MWSVGLFRKHYKLILLIAADSSESCNPTGQFFADVMHQSPSLKRLHMIQVNLTNVSIGLLPNNLESLAITESFLPYTWFRLLTESRMAILPHLKELDLSRSSKTMDADLGHIAQAWSELRVLKLNHCYRVTADGLRIVALLLHRLEVLEIAGTRCDDVAVHHICRDLPATLRRLNVSECLSFTDGCAGTVAATLNNLQSLDVSRCPQLSNGGVLGFAKLTTNLRHLNISLTPASSDTVEQLRRLLPACNIVFEA